LPSTPFSDSWLLCSKISFTCLCPSGLESHDDLHLVVVALNL
jgi:hypothetical protein